MEILRRTLSPRDIVSLREITLREAPHLSPNNAATGAMINTGWRCEERHIRRRYRVTNEQAEDVNEQAMEVKEWAAEVNEHAVEVRDQTEEVNEVIGGDD